MVDRHLTTRWILVILVSIAVLLPEAPNHDYSIGVIQLQIGGIHLADIAVTIFVFLFAVKKYPEYKIKSVYLKPYILLSVAMLFESIIGLSLHPVTEVITEVRSLIPLSLIVLLPSWFDNQDRWELSYYLPVVLMAAAVASVTLALIYQIINPDGTTYGPHIPGHFYYFSSFYGSNFLIPYATIYSIRNKSAQSVFLLLLSASVAIILIITSGGTKHLVFFATTVIMTIIFILRYTALEMRSIVFWTIGLGASGIAVVLSPFFIGVDSIFGLISSLIESNQVRIIQAFYALEQFAHSPFYGQLPGHQYALQIETWLRSEGALMSRPADSSFLSILADFGIIGLLPLLWLFSRYSRLVISNLSDSFKMAPHHAAVLSAAAVTIPTFLIVQPLLTSGLWYSRTQVIFLAFLFTSIEVISSTYSESLVS